MLCRISVPFTFAFVLIAGMGVAATETTNARRQKPELTVADYAYGQESSRQRLDFWRAESDEPAPVVVFIHGGGWRAGDKSSYRGKAIEPLLAQGISVAAINYRFIGEAMEQQVEPPVRACLLDAARAIQTIRHHAAEWNVDPERIAASGSSAGACTSLWLALHDDLADPNSSDPIARHSTRLTCAAVSGAQTSLDPQQLRQWIPNAIYGGHAFGFAGKGRDRAQEFELLLANRQQVLPWIKEYSPIELVSADDPPVFLEYPKQASPPKVGQPEPDPTHSAIYGVKLAEQLDAAGVEAVVSYPGHKSEQYASLREFLLSKLLAE